MATPDFNIRDGYVRALAEGVGTYGVAASVADANLMRVHTASARTVTTKVSQDIILPRPLGTPKTVTKKSHQWGWSEYLLPFSVPSTDTARPPWEPSLQACGLVGVYTNPANYILTYTPKDYMVEHNSITLDVNWIKGANSEVLRRSLVGARANGKISAEGGGLIMWECIGGRAKSNTRSNPGAVGALTLGAGEGWYYENATSAITTVEAVPKTYGSRLHKWSIDFNYEVAEVFGGAANGGPSLVLLRRKDHMIVTLQVEEKDIGASGFNADQIAEENLPIKWVESIPHPSDAKTTLGWTIYGDVNDVSDLEAGPGDMQLRTLTLHSLYPNASNPGLTPAEVFSLVLTTTP